MKSEAEIIRAGAVGVNLEDRAPHAERRSVISLTLPTVFGGARAGPRRELEALGVARASTASAVSLMAMATARQVAEKLR
jgi:2-methylisocitrate lyase-like PEP mutase family enzyme